VWVWVCGGVVCVVCVCVGCVCVGGEGRKSRELVTFATPLALGSVALQNATVQGLINDLQ